MVMLPFMKVCGATVHRRALRGYRRRQWEATAMKPFPSVEHEDAFLLFRALCKLSQRPDHAGTGDGLAVAPTAEEARQMESKAVSLVRCINCLLLLYADFE